MQARRISRELALLSLSQLQKNPSTQLNSQQLQDLLVSAVRTLTAEVQESLELATAELERGSDRLLSSETRAPDLNSARAMTREAITAAQTAINQLGLAIELPETIQLSNQKEVRNYAVQLLKAVQDNRAEIDTILTESMVDWQLKRLLRLDQDILRLAVAEICHIGVADRIVINEAVELAKRYGDDESHRFINGVLRRVTEHLKSKSIAVPLTQSDAP